VGLSTDGVDRVASVRRIVITNSFILISDKSEGNYKLKCSYHST
jgi:hypothetical protein